MNFPWIIFLLIIVLVVLPSICDLSEFKVALAEDINNGKLILTPKAKDFITRGDRQLAGADSTNEKLYTPSWEAMIARAFIAKVLYERARLEMEAK